MFIACAGSASAQQQVYTPINPSFGGNPFNSSHLLGIANAQNNFKDPNAPSNSQSDIFARQLQSRLLAALSNNIVNAIFGPNAQNNGTIDFGGQTISWSRELNQVIVTLAIVSQNGSGNSSLLDQSGTLTNFNNDNVGVFQTGDDNQSTVSQSGNATVALSMRNTVNVHQNGDLNISDVNQGGTDNLADVEQDGSSNQSYITQTGTLDNAMVTQTGPGDISNINQGGSNNSATVTQGGH